jgi:predicted ATPase
MLNGIHIVDFGNHRNTCLTFGPMTALVGKNGSGKTMVMHAIGEAGRNWKLWERGPERIATRRDSGGSTLTASWAEEHIDGRVDWGIEAAAKMRKFRRRWFDHGPTEVWIPAPGGQLSNIKMTSQVTRGVFGNDDLGPASGEIELIDDYQWQSFQWNCRYFKTNAGFLQRSAIADEESPVINNDGSNLAWALAYLMTAEPDRFAQIVEALKEVVPIVKRIRSRPVKLTRFEKRTVTISKQERSFDEEREVMGQELVFDMKSGDGLSATAVSEGTLVVLAVLTLVYGRDDADLIMLDDVELGLHPQAQRDLICQLRKVQKKNPDLQIIVSTHSPYVVDEFKPEDVWLFSTDSEGCAVSKRLSDHPDAKRALEVLTTGEFWSAEGENWVRGEEPTARVAEEAAK